MHVCGNYFTPVGVRSIVINPSVCLFVCPCEHISGTAGPIFTKFVVDTPCGCGSVLLWQRCDMLCTSSFKDDIIFGRDAAKCEVKAEP